jgi:hypothetical protein
MVTAAILIVVLVVLIVGTIMTLRTSSKTGMPSKDVLERATRRARELEARDREKDGGSAE